MDSSVVQVSDFLADFVWSSFLLIGTWIRQKVWLFATPVNGNTSHTYTMAALQIWFWCKSHCRPKGPRRVLWHRVALAASPLRQSDHMGSCRWIVCRRGSKVLAAEVSGTPLARWNRLGSVSAWISNENHPKIGLKPTVPNECCFCSLAAGETGDQRRTAGPLPQSQTQASSFHFERNFRLALRYVSSLPHR